MKAAKIAGLPLFEMMEKVEERKITLQYRAEDFREDFDKALEEKQ